MTNLVLVIPNLLLLCTRLMVDPRVPAKERLLVAGAIVYAFMPLDFIPDMLPFVGQVDDLYLIGLTLLRLMSVSDPLVVREHWRGGGDVVELIGASTLIAAKLLPKKIRRVLTSRVEAPKTPTGKMVARGVLLIHSRLFITRTLNPNHLDCSGTNTPISISRRSALTLQNLISPFLFIFTSPPSHIRILVTIFLNTSATKRSIFPLMWRRK